MHRRTVPFSVLVPRSRPGCRRPASAHRCRGQPVERVVELLTDDALLTMPPEPLEYQGHDAITVFLSNRFANQQGRRVQLVPTRANGQPAFGHYIDDAHAAIARSYGVLVLTLDGDRVAALTRFNDSAVLARFGLPRTKPA